MNLRLTHSKRWTMILLALFMIGWPGAERAHAADSCIDRQPTLASEYQRDIDALMAPLLESLSKLPSGDGSSRPLTRVCQRQVLDYVTHRLHGRIQSMEMQFREGESGHGSTRIVVRLRDLCAGRITFDLLGNKADCTLQGYYGKIPNLISRVQGSGDCSMIIR